MYLIHRNLFDAFRYLIYISGSLTFNHFSFSECTMGAVWTHEYNSHAFEFKCGKWNKRIKDIQKTNTGKEKKNKNEMK